MISWSRSTVTWFVDWILKCLDIFVASGKLCKFSLPQFLDLWNDNTSLIEGFFFLTFREWRREGEREGEKHPCARCVRETSIGCLSDAPNQGPGPQPRHVPWLGIEPATFRCTGQHLICTSQGICMNIKSNRFKVISMVLGTLFSLSQRLMHLVANQKYYQLCKKDSLCFVMFYLGESTYWERG